MKILKTIFLLFTLLTANIGYSQSLKFPDMLVGTWRVDGTDMYEHWDKVRDQNMRGFSYVLKGGEMAVFDHLDMKTLNDGLYLFSNPVSLDETSSFSLTKVDSVYVFSEVDKKNGTHRKISYSVINDNEIKVGFADDTKDWQFIKMSRQHVKDSKVANPNYDKTLATRLGADDYGMKSYYFVILETGTNKTTDKAFINEKFAGHMANINKLVEVGKLIIAGPMGKNEKEYRGIFIFQDIKSLEEAKSLLQSDPAIESGLLAYEIYEWYGSAALPEYLPYSDRIWKVNP